MKSKITKIQFLKKGLAIVLILMFTLLPIENFYGVVNAAANDIEEKLEGGATTIEVDDEVELRALAEIVNTKKNSLKGVEVKLTNNINVSNEQWIPIGTETVPFEGEFEGNGKAINGLTFNKGAYSTYSNVGLFGVIGTSGKVYNLIINNFDINIPYESKDIVPDDFLEYEEETEEGESAEGTPEMAAEITEGRKTVKYKNAGSIAGINKGYIYNCINMNTKSDIKIKAGSYVGGLVGTNEGLITNCTNTVDVIGYDYVGGIAGKNDKTSAIISKTINKGDIEGADSYIGGIIGILNNGNVNFVHNFGDVSGIAKTGGIIGSIDNAGTGRLQYFLGEGAVTVNGETIDKADSLGDDTTRRILIIGDLDDYSRIKYGVVKVDDIAGIFETNHVSGLGSWGTEDENRAYIARKQVSKGYWGTWPTDAYKVSQITYTSNTGKTEFLFKLETINWRLGDIKFNIDDLGANLNTSSLEPVVPEEPEPEPEPDVVPDYAIDVTDKFPKNDGSDRDASKTWFIYKVSKIDKDGNVTVIKEGTSLEIKDTNLKAGDKIRVETTYNKILKNKDGNDLKKEEAPALVVKNLEDKVFTCTAVENVENPDKTKTTKATKITYECEIVEEDEYNIENLLIGDFTNIYAIDRDFKAVGIAGKKELPLELSLDAINPSILGMKVYVEEKLKTGRYPAGTEVIFELSLNEKIDMTKSVIPEILVSFSQSGAGKYNYNILKDTEGYAKYTGTIEDGKTLRYVYKIQEGDEGYINYTYTAGKLVDSSGNVTEVTQPEKSVIEDITGETWNADDLGITYKLFKNGKEISDDTEFVKSDKLTVEVKFDKVLYGRIGELNKTNANVIFEDSDFCKLYVPSLYLRNVVEGEATKIDSNSTEKTTTITYDFDLSAIDTTNQVINADKLVLKNDKNTMVDMEGNFNDGTTYYSAEYKEKYDTAERDLYKEIVLNAAKDLELDYEIIIDLDKESSSEDPESGEGESGKIYADTTAPTVKITTSTSDPTNADEIEYTFTFSEKIKDFTIDKITVNGGEKVGDLIVEKEGRVYKLKVKPTLINNSGFVQVIVEKGACVDLVAKDVIRQEKNITIDKVKSEFGFATIRQEDKKLIIEAIYNENIGAVDTLAPTVTIGGNPARGEWEKPKFDGNKVIFEYNIDPADGGKVEASIKGKVKDVAGNISDEINEKLDCDIVLDRTVIKPGTGSGSDIDEGDYYYTFKKNGEAIASFSNPTYFKYGDILTVEKWLESAEGTEKAEPDITAAYEVKETMDLTHMKYMSMAELVDGPWKTEVNFSATEGEIDISGANIYFDTMPPKVNLSITTEEKTEGDVYSDGKELIITATTSEPVQNIDNIPEIKVSFTNSGVGKYNYQEDTTKGNALYVETIENSDGTVTWKYKYIVQSGDDGKICIGYSNATEITDLAGNSMTLKAYPATNKGEVNLKDIEIEGTGTKVSFEIYKNDNLIDNFTDNTYFGTGDRIKVIAKFNKLLYRENDEIQKVLLTKDDVPTLMMDEKEFHGIIIPLSGGGYYKPKGEVAHNIEDYTTQITYYYEVNAADEEELLDNLSLKTEKIIWAFNKEVTTEEGAEETTEIKEETINKIDIKKDIKNLNLHIYNSTTEIIGGDVIVDTTAPRVLISTDVTSPTNASEIIYTFKFNEKVREFTIDDINVFGGTKDGQLVEVEDGLEYTLKVIPSVALGNEGNVQIIIEEGVCTDQIGLENKRAESIVKVDRKLPILLGLEAFAETDNNTILNEEVDVVKEYYRTGDTITIIATFDESVTTNAKLVLQFSDSGNAKETVNPVTTVGNKIIYTYTINEGDKGNLSIKAFSGKAIDTAGNEIKITKKTLDGDTIIADSTAPKLKELKVVTSEETGTKTTYKEDQTITIEAIYDEEIYVLENQKEIKLVNTDIVVETEKEDGTIEITSTNNAPVLLIKFGDSNKEKEATISGYGTKEDGSVDRTKLIYTYKIVGDREVIETKDDEVVKTLIPGDNGKLLIASYKNKENAEACDIAGNIADLTVKQTGNEIIADTKGPEVKNITAVVMEPSVSNTGIYHKAGNEIIIYVDFNEDVYENIVPYGMSIPGTILIGFSEDPNVEPINFKSCKIHNYVEGGSWGYSTVYTIEDGDNGYLWVKVPENELHDMAGNGNVEKTATRITNNEVFADTTAPYLSTNINGNTQWEVEFVKNLDGQVTGIKAVGIFNEKIFSMKDDALIEVNDIPLMGLFINGTLEEVVEQPTIEVVEGKTKLTYQIDVSDLDTTGTPSVNFIDGTVYDRAGNKMSIELVDGDITSPIFKDIKVVTPNGFYKAGEDIEIVARFNEQTKLLLMPTLKVKLGNKEIPLNASYSSEDPENTDTIKVARYTYKIVDGDNGALNIISLTGKASDGMRTSDEIVKVYSGLVGEITGTADTLLNSEETAYANNQEEYVNVIADTIKPYIAKVEVKADSKVIASYVKDEGKDEVINVGRTNVNELEYVITFSEPVSHDFEKVQLLDTIVYNGTIKEVKFSNKDTHGYYSQVIIKVQTTTEGVQSLMITDDFIKDRAGNENDIARFNIVTADFTKPTIRFISEYNGGTYVLPTNIGKIEIRPNVEISEDIAKIEYKWDDEEYVQIANYSTSSDIEVPTKAFKQYGKHVLYIKVVDLAGNVSETSKTYEIINSTIDINLSTEGYTNQDLTVTVEFGRGLTDNRKVTFKSEKSGEIIELNAAGTDEKGNTQYIIPENGTMYAEATDRVGNKVFTERKITNIDKIAPEISIALDKADLVIGTGKEKAVIKSDVELSDNNWVEDARFAYLQEDININNINAEDKAKISTHLDNEAKIENAESTKGKTPYYLYVIAKDKAGNETIAKAGPFRVFNTNEVTITETIFPDVLEDILNPDDENSEPEIKETKIPPEIEISKLIDFDQDGKTFNIIYNNHGEDYYEIIREKEISLSKDGDGYIDYEGDYVEVNKPTTITVKGYDACGNEVINTLPVTRDMIEGPKFEVYGNPEYWTNQDIKLEVIADEELSSLTVNGQNILSEDKFGGEDVIEENGEYKFVATDVYGITSEKVITVTKIDKVRPEISEAKPSGKNITIIATDIVKEVEGSGVVKYAITDTSEVPVEWSESNVIKVTHDGTFYVWVVDKAGNITRTENPVIVDTTAPIIRFDNALTTVVAGMPIEVNVVTNEETQISYSWDKETWEDSDEFITSVRVEKTYDMTGRYTLYVKATDKVGNNSTAQIEFTVTNPETVLDPQIIFEGLSTTQLDGIKYVIISDNMKTEDVTNKMNKKALCGQTPEYRKLVEDKELKTGSEIALRNDVKYIVVVSGDINCDGKVTFTDIIKTNAVRISAGEASLSKAQLLAADINNTNKIEFRDIISINAIRINSAN